MNNTTKYLLIFLIVIFGLVIIYDSLTKFGMFEGLENQTAPAAPPVAPPTTPPAAAPSPSAPATPPAAAAAAAPENKKASSKKKTPIKTFSF
jgi:hypothetical protein